MFGADDTFYPPMEKFLETILNNNIHLFQRSSELKMSEQLKGKRKKGIEDDVGSAAPEQRPCSASSRWGISSSKSSTSCRWGFQAGRHAGMSNKKTKTKTNLNKLLVGFPGWPPCRCVLQKDKDKYKDKDKDKSQQAEGGVSRLAAMQASILYCICQLAKKFFLIERELKLEFIYLYL